MKLRSGLRFRPNLRRYVFWVALSVMLASALAGLIWAVVERDFGRGPTSVLVVGLAALLVALTFGLLEFTNPTFHPESHLFDWTDVDSLRELERRGQLPEPTRQFVRSLADRIAVVLPGRPAPAQGQSKTPAVRRP